MTFLISLRQGSKTVHLHSVIFASYTFASYTMRTRRSREVACLSEQEVLIIRPTPCAGSVALRLTGRPFSGSAGKRRRFDSFTLERDLSVRLQCSRKVKQSYFPVSWIGEEPKELC